MNIETIFASIFTAAVTATFVATVNHYWNRRYLLAVEREKYRQTLFSEKLKIYNDIAVAIHEFILFAGEVSAGSGPDKAGDLHEKMPAIYRRLMGVNSLIHKHMILIPEETLDQITTLGQLFHKIQEFTDAGEALNRLEILTHSLWKLIDVLRDDLGIEEFGKKLK